MFKGPINFVFDWEGTAKGKCREGRKTVEYFPHVLNFSKLLLFHGSVKLSNETCKNEIFYK